MRRLDLGPLLAHVDAASEDRWSLGAEIANRAGISRRAISQKLCSLEREGFIESKSQGPAPSPRSDAPPRLWRRIVR